MLDQFNRETFWRVLVESRSMAVQRAVPVQCTPYQVAVSADGTRVLYVGGDAYLRELALSAARRITSRLIAEANTFATT